jgi:hypothetical protein
MVLIKNLLVAGSVADPLHFGKDPDPDPTTHASDKWIRILLFSSLTFKTLIKKSFSPPIYIIFQRKKVKKKSQNRRNQLIVRLVGEALQ